jgi:integrase
VASIRQDKRSGRFLVVFRYCGRQFQRSLGTSSRKDALAALARVDDTIRLIERGRIEAPDDVDPADFILSDGRLTKPRVEAVPVRLDELLELYRSTLPPGAKEERTLEGEQLHFKHLLRHFGAKRIVQSIALTDVQDYVASRSRDNYRGTLITVDTIRKELSTFRLVWNWALSQSRVTLSCPTKGVKYPKRDSKQPFMTWTEIERIISRGGLSSKQERDLWGCLFLDVDQVGELLDAVRKTARHDFIYPLFLFAAHTGARRSEMLRSRIDDFDFDLNIVHIREKKRSRTRSTTFRQVPMSRQLSEGMRSWFSGHPGGQFTLSNADGAMATHTATNHFRLTLKDTRWDQRLRGFHALRHSFASNAAAVGIDPGMIDSWMGHQTEEMRNRYRHLFPKQQQTAMGRLFEQAVDRKTSLS